MPRFAFHPENLFSLSTLLGVQATNFSSARILEIGCGSAKDLITIASQLPQATCIGIDNSDIIIEEAQIYADRLKLTNLTLKVISILDISEDTFGQFDYIIAQNLFSYVPETIQNAIFKLFEELLTPNGIAYISYNTLPGWNMAQSIREIAQYHTENDYITSDKATQTRALITFLRDNIPDKDSAYGSLLNQELSLLKDENYLFSNYLSEHNIPYYFQEFMRKAKAHQLQYLSDAAIETMFIGNFSDNIRSQLQPISHDIIKTEQYLDFLTNRRFRMTLLCRENIPINRNLTSKNLKGFYLKVQFLSHAPIELIEIQSGEMYHFSTASGIQFSTSNAIELSLLKIVGTTKTPMHEETICEKILASLPELYKDQPEAQETILNSALRLVLAGALQLHTSEGTFTRILSEKPCASILSRLQAKEGNKVISALSEPVIIDDFGRLLMQYLDGRHDKKALIKKMMSHFEENNLTLSFNGKTTSNPHEIKKYLQDTTDNLLKEMAENGLLVS